MNINKKLTTRLLATIGLGLLASLIIIVVRVQKKIHDPVFFGLLGGRYFKSLRTDPLIGKQALFESPTYVEGCTSCESLSEWLNINRTLYCATDIDKLASATFMAGQKKITLLPSSTTFTVVEVFRAKDLGFNALELGPGNYRIALLKDESGLLSTVFADKVESGKLCYFPMPVN